MQIEYLPKFARQYKKLPRAIQQNAERAEKIFRADPFDSRLKTHKLSGPLRDFYAFSVTHTHRIIFDFGTDTKMVRFYSIGTHDIYE